MTNWKTYQWGDLATLEYGKSLKGYKEGKGSIPVFGTNGLIGWTDKILCDFPSVVIGRKGAYRGVHYSNQPFFVIDTAFYLKPKTKNLDLKYAYYQLLTVDINSLDSGSAIPSTSREDFYGIPIKLPPLTEQKAIAEILSSLDDKIELNNQINKNLEALAQAIFKQWFVDFEFPNENGEPYKSSGGSFQNSVFGKIPTGWGSERLASQINVERGLSYKGSGLCSEVEGIPMHNLNSVYEGGGYKYDGIKYYKGEYKDRHLLKPWDIIVTNTEQGHKYLLIGCPAIVPKYFGDTGIFSQHIFKVTSKETVTNQFIYYLLLTPYIREQVIGCTNGTTVNMLSKDGLKMPLFALSPKELIDKFSEIVIPIWQKKETIYKENQELSKLRDALIPKLMSGELTVSQAEKVAS